MELQSKRFEAIANIFHYLGEWSFRKEVGILGWIFSSQGRLLLIVFVILINNNHMQLSVYNIIIPYSPVFLISSYGAPLAQRVSNLAQRSSLFGPDGAVNYDYIVTNSIISLFPNGTHTNHCWANLAHTSNLKLSKTLV